MSTNIKARHRPHTGLLHQAAGGRALLGFFGDRSIQLRQRRIQPVEFSAEIARAVFENNTEAIYRAMTRRLVKGDVRAFKILAERAYGKVKVKEHVELELTADLAERLKAARQRLSETEFTRQANERERKVGVPNVPVKAPNSVDDDVA